jgi:hypothetical protein
MELQMKRNTWHIANISGSTQVRYGWECAHDGQVIDPADPRPDGYKLAQGMFYTRIMLLEGLIWELEYVSKSAKFTTDSTVRYWGKMDEVLEKLRSLRPAGITFQFE